MTPHTPAADPAAAYAHGVHHDPITGEIVIPRATREHQDLRPVTDLRHPSTPGSDLAGLAPLPVTAAVLAEVDELGLTQPLAGDEIFAQTLAEFAARRHEDDLEQGSAERARDAAGRFLPTTTTKETGDE